MFKFAELTWGGSPLDDDLADLMRTAEHRKCEIFGPGFSIGLPSSCVSSERALANEPPKQAGRLEASDRPALASRRPREAT